MSAVFGSNLKLGLEASLWGWSSSGRTGLLPVLVVCRQSFSGGARRWQVPVGLPAVPWREAPLQDGYSAETVGT